MGEAQVAAASGVDLIAAERERQVSAEGWTPEHDDTHADEELAFAAMCYVDPDHDRWPWGRVASGNVPYRWPWEREAWKPSGDTTEGRVRELAKAGALIAAEIDRLQRHSAGA